MKLFTNATLKLAGWYLIILMTVSLLFSVIIYQVAKSEVQSRLDRILDQREIAEQYLSISPELPNEQLDIATTNLLISLVYINITVLLIGGAGAYFLAKQTLKPIEDAHKVQSRFVANASHQLRTPLSIIKAETELVLSDENSSEESLRQTLTSNLEEINHLSNLSTMLLELSKSETSLKSTVNEINLNHLVSEIIKNRKISSRTQLVAKTDVLLIGHEVATRELLNILIDNSIKHSPKNSPIHIELTETRQVAMFCISNEGEGIDKKQISHVFERFYRSSSSEGYGLGLSLAKQLIRSLDGSLTIESIPGKITKFRVSLPKK